MTSGTQIRLNVVPVGDRAFEGDLFERKKVADRLTRSLKMLRDGGAISVESPWGAGKSWFARNWKLDLEDQGFRVAYIDAFACDHMDDPFLMIAGELLSVARQDTTTGQSLLELGGKVGRAILPVGTRVVTGIASKWLVGEKGAEAIEDAYEKAVESAGELVEKEVEKRLEEYQSAKATVQSFRNVLSNLTGGLQNPLVVLVDELDRCRPDFALRTIERIKHFFEVPGLVFVLLINREQLCASIQGAYGPTIDADGYLRKFLVFSLKLPRGSDTHGDFNVEYCKESLKVFGFPDKDAHAGFAQMFGRLATAFGLQLRDVERGVALYALAQPLNSLAPVAAWLIAVKLWAPDIFQGFLRGDRSAHQQVIERTRGISSLGGVSPIVSWMIALHRSYADGFTTQLPAEPMQYIRQATNHSIDVDRVIPWLLGKIDLPVT